MDGRLRQGHPRLLDRCFGTTASGAPIITYGWYHEFVQLLVDSHAEGWFSKVIVFGELAVGLGLILGATSTNPVLAVLGILLILAWKNAGYVGLDRFLLPALGTPWAQPKLNKPATPAPRPAVAPTQ